MAMPLRQSLRLGALPCEAEAARREKFPLLVELEPLFACNLKCAGCGKIQQPHTVLKQRMPVEQAVAAIEECGAPMVSIAGGEPLMHPQIDEIVRQLLARKKIVFLCTNAVLLPKHLHRFTPHRNFAWMVHIDGLRERHDESVCKDGVLRPGGRRDQAGQGGRLPGDDQHDVLQHRHPAGRHRRARLPQRRPRRRQHADLARLRLREGAGPGALARRRARPASCSGRRSPTAGARSGGSTTRRCSSTSSRASATSPARRGASRRTRCWAGSGPATCSTTATRKTYQELIETTDWDAFGRGKDPRCANCMAHCGYEPTAVIATMGSLKESLRAAVAVLSVMSLLDGARAARPTLRAARRRAAGRARRRDPGAADRVGVADRRATSAPTWAWSS